MKVLRYLLVAFLLLANGCQRNGGIPDNMDCIAKLRQLDAAKEQWAIENHKSTNDVPTMADIAPFLPKGRSWSCRAGGVYTLGRVGEKSKCSVKGHEFD